MTPYGSMMTEPMHEGRELPSFRLREIDLPQIKTWEVGGKYYLVIEVELTGKRENKYEMPDEAPESDKMKIDADFKMLSIKELEEKEANNLEKAAFEDALAKAKGMK